MERSLAVPIIDPTHAHNQVWLAYDKAFREDAAATNLKDWSASSGNHLISMPLELLSVLLRIIPLLRSLNLLQQAHLRLFANPGIKVTVLSHQLPATLCVNVPVDKAHTSRNPTRLMLVTPQSLLQNDLGSPHLTNPVANPAACRNSPPPGLLLPLLFSLLLF